MKKFVLAALSLFVATGLILAASVVVVKCDEKEITVKDGDKETTYKITDKTVLKFGDKDVAADKREGALKMLANPKAAGKMKIDITVEKDALTEIKMPERKKKTDKN